MRGVVCEELYRIGRDGIEYNEKDRMGCYRMK
jgi:hypothetical protein